MFGMLHITAPNTAQRTIEVSRATTIGRDADNDIVLDDQAVSRCHALLLAQPGGVALVDLESTNGTFVNDVLVPPDQRITLRDGDVIMIGAALLRYDAPARPRTSFLDMGAQPRAVLEVQLVEAVDGLRRLARVREITIPCATPLWCCVHARRSADAPSKLALRPVVRCCASIGRWPSARLRKS